MDAKINKIWFFSGIAIGFIVGCIGIAISLKPKIDFYKTQITELENQLSRAIISEPDFMYQSPREGLKEALEYFDIKNPDIVYAQAILETGNFKSNLCIYNNNLFGLYDSKNKRYHKFNHWTESVIAYRDWIQYKYNLKEDYYDFLKRINYAEDTLYINKLKYIVNNE